MNSDADSRFGRGLRAPWRRGAWSRLEVAAALQARRGELRRIARARGIARGASEEVLDEVVDDAIRVVVMMRKPILSEEHLMGAFWATARLLLHQHREGRHGTRLGGRRRVDFEEVAGSLVAEDPGVEEVLVSKERAARAADLVAQLSELERNVFVVMAVQGLGIKAAARTLGLPLERVKAAQRAARGKLDRVAAISTAGRMCGYRQASVVAYAQGSSSAEQERVALAHIAACASCRVEYRRLVRELRGGAFRRGTAAAFLPALFLSVDERAGFMRHLLGWLASRPRAGGERVLEALGGAGAVKVAAAGSAVVVATATLAGVRPQTLLAPSPRPAPRHVSRAVAQHVRGERRASTASTNTTRRVMGNKEIQGRRVLTPQQHAELEFSSLSSPRTGRVRPSEQAPAEVVGVQAGIPSQEYDTSSGSHSLDRSSGAGATKAAREFGQP